MSVNREINTRDILEAMPDGILILNQEYAVVMCNQASCELFGYQTDELLNTKITDLIKNTEYQDFNILNIFEKENPTGLFELIALQKNERFIPIEVAISKLTFQNEISYICVIRNIFTRKRTQQLIIIRHQITRILAEHSSLDEVTPKILKIICETMQLQIGSLWKVDHINYVLRCKDIWTTSNKEIMNFSTTSKSTFTFSKGVGIPGRVWQDKKSCWIEDISKDADFNRSSLAQQANLRSAFAFPILFEGEVVGVLEFFMKELYSFDTSIMDFLNDISNQIGIFIERVEAQERVNKLSRLAGMADVASNVLHNVGNTLNSINISCNLITENINNSKVEDLSSLVKLLNQHQDNIASFLSQDKKGQHSVKFLSLLANEWVNENHHLSNEVKSLEKNIQHVKSIISMQQSLSHVAGITEEVSISELLDDALTLNKIEREQEAMNVIHEYSAIKRVTVDKVKIFQIFVNLIQNAIEAMANNQNGQRQLTLRIHEHDDTYFMVQVTDNGIGIAPDNITKIFSPGYTTKKSVHDFGLHMSAIYAKEMGGILIAESGGLGLGATFTLTLPYFSKASQSENQPTKIKI